MIELHQAWDFHTDIRYLVLPESAHQHYRAKQLDLETCRRMGGVFSATGRNATVSREEQLERLDREVAFLRQIPGLTLVRAATEVAGAGRQVLHAEGIYFVQEERDLDRLERLWDMGFRSLAPLYNEDNALGGGARGDPCRGLTALGRRFLLAAWKRGFLLDCAHGNHKTISEALDLARVEGCPLNYSHGHLDEPALELFGQRGLPKALVERLAQTGGLIGLSPHPGFQGYFKRFLEEVAFLARVVPDHAVLGSDFAGITSPPVAFADFSSAASIPQFSALLNERHGAAFASGFCGGTVQAMLERRLPR